MLKSVTHERDRRTTLVRKWGAHILLVIVLGLFLYLRFANTDKAPTPKIGYAQSPRTVETELVPFDKLFVLEDTVHLDRSVIIGGFEEMDVSNSGDLLITDHVARSVYRFSATGELLHELTVAECDPGAERNHWPKSARFLPGGGALMWDGMGKIHLFNKAGQCIDLVRSEHFVNISGICARQDSIFTMPHMPKFVKAKVFTSSFELLEEIELETPKWPALMGQVMLAPGRSLECFDDDAWYTYIYHADAKSLRFKSIQHQPPFLVERRRDIPSSRGVGDLRSLSALYDASRSRGLFRLDSSTRVMVHTGLRYRKGVLEGDIGLTIVDHKDRFVSVSTTTSMKAPKGAGNGRIYFRIYFRDGHESLPDGGVGNPMLLRYRFIPPQPINDD